MLRLTYNEWLRYQKVTSGLLQIDGPIQSGYAQYLLGELMTAKAAPIKTIYLNSPGGDVYEALAIHDLIRSIGPAKVVAVGLCASAAAMTVLQAGEPRLTLPNTRFMLHELARLTTSPTVERQSEMQDATAEMKKLQEHVLNILSKRVGKPPKDLVKAIGRKDLWLTANEALAWNLVDGIVPCFS